MMIVLANKGGRNVADVAYDLTEQRHRVLMYQVWQCLSGRDVLVRWAYFLIIWP